MLKQNVSFEGNVMDAPRRIRNKDFNGIYVYKRMYVCCA